MLAAVITTYNRELQLGRCLWTLFQHSTLKPDVACIVDDSSQDSTCERLADWSKLYPLRWMRRERASREWQNPARPRNMAIRMAKDADYLLFVEPEMLVLADTLQILMDVIARNENAWANATHQAFAKRMFADDEWRAPEALWQQPFVRVEPRPHLAVRCAIVPRAAVWAVTGYPEYAEGWGCDDTAFMTQLQTYGCRAVNEFGARIIHQWHLPAPANADTANRNQAIMQQFCKDAVYAVNGPAWGTDGGKYPDLAN